MKIDRNRNFPIIRYHLPTTTWPLFYRFIGLSHRIIGPLSGYLVIGLLGFFGFWAFGLFGILGHCPIGSRRHGRNSAIEGDWNFFDHAGSLPRLKPMYLKVPTITLPSRLQRISLTVTTTTRVLRLHNLLTHWSGPTAGRIFQLSQARIFQLSGTG